MKLERPRIESTEPVVRFAAIRLGLSLVAIAGAAAASFPYDGRLAAALGGIAVPWSVGVLLLARRSPAAALSPVVAAGDLMVLASVEAIVPEVYGPVRFAALLFISAHAQFQGERIGLLLALAAIGLLVPIAVLRPDPLEGDRLLLFSEVLFSAVAIAAAVAVGAVRTAESTGRVRAWELTRRTMEAESKIRRKLAETIHDGPVQELASLDMMLAAASQAAAKGDGERAQEAIGEARTIAVRNVEALRDEIVSLGPYAFEELSFHTAVEDCVPTWQRRYGLEVKLELESMTLPLEVAGMLFQIVQEAVTNTGRHAQAATVRLALRRQGRMLELRVVDDGRGFGDVSPLAANEPGHIGLASMRERAEMLGGRLEIVSDAGGTAVVVTAPLE